jgi:hypothetical protein
MESDSGERGASPDQRLIAFAAKALATGIS